MEKKEQPILSLCIPTFNRADTLRGNLEQIHKQLHTINPDELELIVSNNCSPDNTDDVVRAYTEQGMSIVYNKNIENLGADGNFLTIMRMATGKYMLLLSDDDYLVDGALKDILNYLREKDYGLVYIDYLNPTEHRITEYTDVNKFICEVGRHITCISANIFRTDVIPMVEGEKYRGTLLLQVPYYLTSCVNSNVNAIINAQIIQRDIGNLPSEEKFDFIQIFSNNYLALMISLLEPIKKIKKSTISFFKKQMLIEYTGIKIYHTFIKTGKWRNDERWRFVWPYYKNEWFFYLYMLKCFKDSVKRKLSKILHV